MFAHIRRRAATRLPLAAALSLSLASAAPAWAQGAPPVLALGDALARARAADPTIAASDARLVAAEANLRQVGVRPNPTLGVDLENFAGTGAYSLLDRTEATVSYQQTFERGGKREARTDRARAELEVARLRREVRSLDLLKAVQVAYVEALAAEAQLLIAEARLISARRSQADIDRRVKQARDPLFAGSRAEASTAQTEIERDQARVAARDARALLARFWGGDPDFSFDLETFFQIDPPSDPGPLASADLALLEAERDAAVADLRIERARAVADPTLRAGVRYLGEGSNIAFVVGGTIPLQRYDTNRAGIERAQASRVAAEIDIAAERTIREREVARLTARLAAAARESERIRTEVTPFAIRAVDQVREGFNRGGFEYLDVTEAERALADSRARRVTLLRQYHLDRAELDRLTGRHALATPATPAAELRR